MMICPDCSHPFLPKESICKNCNWQCQIREGIPVYLSTQDLNNSMFKQYIENYDNISKDDLETSIQDPKYLETQNNKLFSYLPKIKGMNVCEIGVGKGILLKSLLKEDPAKVTGIDISLPYLKMLKDDLNDKALELLIANGENIPFSEEFDIIIASDILEHVLNVGDFLGNVNRALKPGGYFVVKAPYNEDINVYSKLRGCKYDFVHLRNFTEKSLKTILKGAGFSVEKIVYDGFIYERKRSLFKGTHFLSNLCDHFLQRKFSNLSEINTINNKLGNLLMNPLEITAISKKEREFA